MSQRKTLVLGALILALTACVPISGQSGERLYQQMSSSEQSAFIAHEARAIARTMSGAEYQFTPAFEMEIQRALEKYVRRIGNGGDRLGKGDMRFVLERGKNVAPGLIAVFKSRNVSPLIGLYLPLIESEYVNVPSDNSAGALGMFQFLPATGKRYGLSTNDLLSVDKSADAAARYIAANINKFGDDPMKEALALLAYNRGASNVQKDLELVMDYQSKQCSICALTAAQTKLDATFREENVYYVPSFFAAAIIGENPQRFGLKMERLSSYEK